MNSRHKYPEWIITFFVNNRLPVPYSHHGQIFRSCSEGKGGGELCWKFRGGELSDGCVPLLNKLQQGSVGTVANGVKAPRKFWDFWSKILVFTLTYFKIQLSFIPLWAFNFLGGCIFLQVRWGNFLGGAKYFGWGVHPQKICLWMS